MNNWDGDGLPPVGTVCEMHSNDEMTVKVLAYGKHGRDDAALVCETYHGVDDQMHGVLCKHVAFRPIRSEEDRAVESMLGWIAHPHGERYAKIMVKQLYNAIRDGKVPGIKLEEDV